MQAIKKPQRNILYMLLVLFVASLIMFDSESYVIYSNIINIMLWGGVLLGLFLGQNVRLYKNPIGNIYFLFTVFALLSCIWATDYSLALDYTKRLVIALINLYVIYFIFKAYNLEDAVLYGIIAGAFFNYLIAFGLISAPFELYEYGRFLGSVGNPNKLSRVMALSIFASIVLMDRQKNISNKALYIFLVINIILSFYLIFLSVSKKGLIIGPALILSTIRLSKINFSRLLGILVIVAGSVYLIISYVPATVLSDFSERTVFRVTTAVNSFLTEGGGDASTIERQELFEEGIRLFSENPIVGVGLNNFRFYFTKYAHNNFIELLTGLGIIGFALFYSIYFKIFGKIKNMYNSNIKRYLYIMVFAILFMDVTTVSYFDKLILIVLLYLYSTAEKNKKGLFVRQ